MSLDFNLVGGFKMDFSTTLGASTRFPPFLDGENRRMGKTCGIYANSFAFAALKTDASVVTWGLPTGGGDSRAVRQERCRDDLGGYPLVNIQKKYGTSPSLIAKFTIYIYTCAIFNSYCKNYQRVFDDHFPSGYITVIFFGNSFKQCNPWRKFDN